MGTVEQRLIPSGGGAGIQDVGGVRDHRGPIRADDFELRVRHKIGRRLPCRAAQQRVGNMRIRSVRRDDAIGERVIEPLPRRQRERKRQFRIACNAEAGQSSRRETERRGHRLGGRTGERRHHGNPHRGPCRERSVGAQFEFAFEHRIRRHQPRAEVVLGRHRAGRAVDSERKRIVAGCGTDGVLECQRALRLVLGRAAGRQHRGGSRGNGDDGACRQILQDVARTSIVRRHRLAGTAMLAATGAAAGFHRPAVPSRYGHPNPTGPVVLRGAI